jgi:3-methyl-2-oxobutanoate hydroxymethyltransferase
MERSGRLFSFAGRGGRSALRAESSDNPFVRHFILRPTAVFPSRPSDLMSAESSPPDVADVPRVTTQTVQEMKDAGVPIAVLTAYDYTSARLFDQAGVDVLLVGDSASNVMAGNETTLPMTLDQMVYHAQCVVRGINRALVVVDLPFGSYQGAPEEALQSAIRVMKETGSHAVKLEGGAPVVESVERMVTAGIPVMGHLGLTPQSIYNFGTYQVRARGEAEAEQLRADAKRLEAAGCFALVLEKIPAELAQEVTESLSIPTIGIGAGNQTDGQVLVSHDALGLSTDFTPRFVRRYARLDETITEAIDEYVSDVRDRSFPADDESY